MPPPDRPTRPSNPGDNPAWFRRVNSWLNLTAASDRHAATPVEPVRLGPGDRPSLWNLILHAVRGFGTANLPQMSAALAYRTIFGLVPIVIIGLAIVGGLAGERFTRDFVDKVLNYTGIRGIDAGGRIAVEPEKLEKIADPKDPDALNLDPAAVPPSVRTPPDSSAPTSDSPPSPSSAASTATTPSPSSPPVASPSTSAAPPSAPADNPAASSPPASTSSAPDGPLPDPLGASAERQRLDEVIQGLVERVRSIPFTTIGVIGFIVLLYAAISMVVEVESAFNRIYEAPSGRSWAQRIPRYWTLLSLGPISLFATFYVGDKFNGFVQHLTESAGIGSLQQSLIFTAGFITQVAITTTLLLVIYFTVPNARVRFAPALAGAILAAIAWEALKYVFTTYVSRLPSYATFYGSIAVVPLFLFWIYFTWLIVLGGLQLARSLQVFGALRGLGPAAFIFADEPSKRDPAIIDPAFVAPVAAIVGQRFLEGQPTDSPGVARALGVTPYIAETILSRLADAGLFTRVAPGPGEEFAEARYALARPPQRITASELLHLGFAISDAARRDDAAAPLMARFRAAQLRAAEGLTLADEIGLAPEVPPASTPPSPDPASASDSGSSSAASASNPAHS